MEYIKESILEHYAVKDLQEFDAIRLQFYEAAGCSSIFDLATFLDTSPAHISDARRRLQVPLGWFRLVAHKTEADLALLQEAEAES